MYKNKVTKTKQLCYIGSSIGQGQKIEGVQKTPQLMRQAGLFKSLTQKFGVTVHDYGNISIKNQTTSEIIPEQQFNIVHNLPLLDNLLEKINNTILKSLKQHPDSVVVTVGGDHSVGTATLHALHTHYKDLKVIWVDAHPDFIDSSKSQYYGYHGYPVAHATGLTKFPGFKWLTNYVPFENIVYIAIRDIDPDEWQNLPKYNIKCFTMDHVTDLGIGEVMNQAIKYLDPVGDKKFHISFDIDAIDPQFAFGTGTKFRGGLTGIEANQIVRRVAHDRHLVGLDVVQINVDLEKDQPRIPLRGENNLGPVTPTLGLGVDLIESIFTQYFGL